MSIDRARRPARAATTRADRDTWPRGGLALLVLLVLGCSPSSPTDANVPTVTPRGALVLGAEAPSYEIGGGEIDGYTLTTPAKSLVVLSAGQDGIDVALRLIAPDGTVLGEADSPSGAYGAERLVRMTLAAGEHRVEVEAAAGKAPGRYRLQLETSKPADERAFAQVAAHRQVAQGDALRQDKRFAEAATIYRRAARALHAAGDPEGSARALWRCSLAHRNARAWQAAIDTAEAAATWFESAGRHHEAALTRDSQARARFQSGDIEGAAATFTRALTYRRKAGDRRGEGITSNNLGYAWRMLGRLRQAERQYRAASEIWRSLGRRQDEADTRYNLGVLLRHLGQDEDATQNLEASLGVFTEDQALGKMAAAHDQLARIDAQHGATERARDRYQQSLALAERAQDPTRAATVQLGLGRLDLATGEIERAEQRLRDALGAFRRLDDPSNEGRALLYLGRAANARGAHLEALALLADAAVIQARMGDLLSQADTARARARAFDGTGRLESAISAATRAIEIYESLRRQPIDPDRRARYFATVQDTYDLRIELEMAMHARVPGAHWNRRAFATGERARARSLIDLLARSGVSAALPENPALAARVEALEARIEQLSWQIQLPGRDAETARATREDLHEAEQALTATHARLRASSPRFAARVEPEPLDLEALQALLAPSDQILVYRLGARQAHAWVVHATRFASAPLGPSDAIVEAAQGAHRALRHSHRREAWPGAGRALCRLSRLVLAPVVGMLDRPRLAVVPEGALASVPFSALPDPDDCDGAPLIERHEIVQLPSASALGYLRSSAETRRREPAPGLLAVVADPVYEADDPRLGDLPATSADGARPSPRQPLGRLRHAGDEGRAILALAARGDVGAFGIEASRDRVRSGLLTGFRYLHFASHAWIDPDRPDRSGIVLSRFDARGRPVDGLLRLEDIYDLELDADLVTLSACRTALGPTLPGEGVIGLGRGFLHAGAARVLASLWPIDDRATAVLMRDVYERLLDQDRSPGTALREAQRALRRDPRWRAPYHWASFVLQGDW